MTIYSAKVMVEYLFEFDSEDYGIETEREAYDHAYYNFSDFPYSADVYSVDVEAEEPEDDEDEEESEDE